MPLPGQINLSLVRQQHDVWTGPYLTGKRNFYGNLRGNGRFQKISIPIPRTAFWISEGEGGFTIMEF